MSILYWLRGGVPLALLLALGAFGGTATVTIGGGAPATTAATPSASASSGPASTWAAISARTASASSSFGWCGSTTGPVAYATAGGGVAATGSSGPGVSFKADILPIFDARCTSCHGTGRTAGLSLASNDEVLTGGNHGPAVRAGDADGSLPVQKVRGTQSIGGWMPRGGPPLTGGQIQKIAIWLAQGAPNN